MHADLLLAHHAILPVRGKGTHDKALRMSALELRLQELQDWEFLSAFQRPNAKQLRESKASD